MVSYDIVGDIAIIKLSDEILHRKGIIAKRILQEHKNVRVVCLNKGVRGEFRTRDLEIVAGEKRTVTTHVEYGLVIEVDVGKCFFTPRLAFERMRVARQVKKDQVVVDMFTGVAPFALVIAKYAQPGIVYAIDKNPYAMEFAYKNISRNKLLHKIELIEGDAREAVKGLYQNGVRADHVIMNLPFSAYNFLDSAMLLLKNTIMIHYYDIINRDRVWDRASEIEKTLSKRDTSAKIKNLRMIKTYSPREVYIGMDIEVCRRSSAGRAGDL